VKLSAVDAAVHEASATYETLWNLIKLSKDYAEKYRRREPPHRRVELKSREVAALLLQVTSTIVLG
jgi:hypothetical protein